MIYREVNATTVPPVSTINTDAPLNSIEPILSQFFFSKGQDYFKYYKACRVKSNSTFLKDLFANIDSTLKERKLSEKEINLLNLTISTIINQIKILEELFGQVDVNILNAIICGTLSKHITKYIS